MIDREETSIHGDRFQIGPSSPWEKEENREKMRLKLWGTGGLCFLLTAALLFGAAVPAADAASSDWFIEVNKATNQLTLYQGGKVVKTYSIATGRSQNLTPEGTFEIVVKFVKPGWKGIAGGLPENPLGERWLGLRVKGDKGRTYGIHGTNDPSTIGTHASSGCVRMQNRDVIDLYNRVPLGTKVKIHNGNRSGNKPSTQAASGQVTITATVANLRWQPSLQASVVDQLKKNTQLPLIKRSGDWYRVKRADGQAAYVHHSVARKGSITAPPSKGNVTVTAQLANVRNAPSMSGDVQQRVAKGTQLNATGKKGNWIQIRLKSGQIAYIHQNIVR